MALFGQTFQFLVRTLFQMSLQTQFNNSASCRLGFSFKLLMRVLAITSGFLSFK